MKACRSSCQQGPDKLENVFSDRKAGGETDVAGRPPTALGRLHLHLDSGSYIKAPLGGPYLPFSDLRDRLCSRGRSRRSYRSCEMSLSERRIRPSERGHRNVSSRLWGSLRAKGTV